MSAVVLETSDPKDSSLPKDAVVEKRLDHSKGTMPVYVEPVLSLKDVIKMAQRRDSGFAELDVEKM